MNTSLRSTNFLSGQIKISLTAWQGTKAPSDSKLTIFMPSHRVIYQRFPGMNAIVSYLYYTEKMVNYSTAL